MQDTMSESRITAGLQEGSVQMQWSEVMTLDAAENNLKNSKLVFSA